MTTTSHDDGRDLTSRVAPSGKGVREERPPKDDPPLHVAFDPSTWSIPTGMAGIRYHINRTFSKDMRTKHADYLTYLDWKLEDEEAKEEHRRECVRIQEELDARNKVEKRKFKRNLVREISNRGIQPTVNFKCWKSGSKTTLAANVGSILAEESTRVNVLLPSTMSTSSGASGTVTGLKSDNFLTLTKFANKLDTITDPRALADSLPATRHGLRVVVEDAETDFAGKLFDTSAFKPIVYRTYTLIDGCVLEDDGNEDIKEGTVAVTAARCADVIVLSASYTQPHSVSKMVETLGMLKKDPYQGLDNPQGDYLPGELRSTRDKVEHAIIVINGVKPEDEEYDFDALRGHNVHEFSEAALPEWNGQGFTVRWDPYVYGGHNVQNPVDLDKIEIGTYDDYLDITLAILLEGARALGKLERLNDLQLEYQPHVFVAPPEPNLPQPEYASNKAA